MSTGNLKVLNRLPGKRFKTFKFPVLINCCFHKVNHTHSWNFYRILKTQKNAFFSPVLWRHLKKVLPQVSNCPLCNINKLPASQNCSQSAFSRTIRSHYCMNLSRFNLKTDSLQNTLT